MKEFLSSDRFRQLLIRLVLVVIPTALIGYITLRFVNFSYTALQTGIGRQTLYFTIGLALAYTLYYYGARILVSLLLLWLGYVAGERIIVHLPGEFDVFFATARYQLYATVFFIGWFFGFLLARFRWANIVIFGLLAVVTLASTSDTTDVSLDYILLHLLPVVVYGLYMLFLSPVLTERIEITGKKTGRFVIRVALFALLVILALFITESLLRGNLKAVEKELAARGAKGKNGDASKQDGYDDRNGLMEKTDDGYRLKDTMKVNSKMSQSDKLMFCAKLDNFFPDGSPAPLYFVYHYLTRYDQTKESFTRDIGVPSFDEMEVDPARLPMYYSYTDTSIIRKSMADQFRKITEANIYLSENTWKHAVLSPSSAFHIQTIPVEKDFQKTFLSAYKIAAYTSELNNAYFVYNISASEQLEPIQEQRHDELRKVKDYRKVDKKFLEYYTDYPMGGIYDSISKLAKGLVDANAKPVDKVIAVRDFFLRRNENGKRIFRYSLKAGAIDDPNIPSSKMLYNFLFKTHTGYCTYYAGASLFMLRSLGVPTRFTTGFATVNRSDEKNKGWYWFYASQAHAWTQVYFPGYGWMDFDMTIGNEDQQQAPKPDGTPPLPPPDPWLVLSAKAETAANAQKQLTASFKDIIYLDRPYHLNQTTSLPIDASLCRVLYNKRDTTLAAVQPGDSLIIVSYKEENRRIPPRQEGVAIDDQVAKFPRPIIADEIHIRGKEKPKSKDSAAGKKKKPEGPTVTLKQIALAAGITLGAIALLLLLFPLLFLLYRLARLSFAGSGTKKADEVYRTALYRFHMAGLERDTETPLEYAERKVDPTLSTHFASFMRLYLRLKYAPGTLQQEDQQAVQGFAKEVAPAIRKRVGFLRAALNYFRVVRAIRYFQQPSSSETENQSL